MLRNILVLHILNVNTALPVNPKLRTQSDCSSGGGGLVDAWSSNLANNQVHVSCVSTTGHHVYLAPGTGHNWAGHTGGLVSGSML